MTIFRPDIEAAADAAIGADGLGLPGARLAHVRFHFGELENGAVAHLRLNVFHHIDHPVERGLG